MPVDHIRWLKAVFNHFAPHLQFLIFIFGTESHVVDNSTAVFAVFVLLCFFDDHRMPDVAAAFQQGEVALCFRFFETKYILQQRDRLFRFDNVHGGSPESADSMPGGYGCIFPGIHSIGRRIEYQFQCHFVGVPETDNIQTEPFFRIFVFNPLIGKAFFPVLARC